MQTGTDAETSADYAELAVPSPLDRQPARSDPLFGDLTEWKIDPDEAGLAGAELVLGTAPVRKPPAEEFVRVHPGKDMTIALMLYESRDAFTSVYYVVKPQLIRTMTADARGGFFAQLYVTVTRAGMVMLWPVKLPTGGASNQWHESALIGAETAKSHWIRIYADPEQKQYVIKKAIGDFEDPKFPDKSLNELLEIAFRGRVIDSVDHSICRRLRGEI